MESLFERIKIHEGLRLKPYVDTVGKLSIGYGRNLTDRGINQTEALMMLRRDIDEATEQFEKIEKDFHLQLNDVRRGVNIELIFWIGLGGFLKFKKMIAAIKAGDFEKAADELLDSKLNSQTPERCRQLSMLMRDGQ